MGFHLYVEYKTETHRHIQQYGGYQRDGGGDSKGLRGLNLWWWKMI